MCHFPHRPCPRLTDIFYLPSPPSYKEGFQYAAALRGCLRGCFDEASASAHPEACGTVEMMENPRGGSGLPHHHRSTATASYVDDQGEAGAERDCFRKNHFCFS